MAESAAAAPPPDGTAPVGLDALLRDLKALELEAEKVREMEVALAALEAGCSKEFARIDRDLKKALSEVSGRGRGRKSGEIGSGTGREGHDGDARDDTAAAPAEDEQARLIALGTTMRHRLSLLRTTLPQPPGLLLRWSLGTPTPSHIRTHTARLAYKTSYESFKLRMTVFSSVFALANLFLPGVRLADTLFQFALLYYYSTVTLRELVLSANGSRIRTWWLAHHVLTAVMTGLLLIWPASSDSYARFRPVFYSYAMYLGLVQYLQYRYQTARLYALRSLGRTNAMETIAGGEGAAAIGGREVEWLVPFLAIGWLWQGVCSWWATKLWWEESWDGGSTGPWQALGVGALFLVLGTGNAWMTIVTFREKAVADKWRQRGRSGASSIRASSPGSKPRSVSRGGTRGSPGGFSAPLAAPAGLAEIPPFERHTPSPRPGAEGRGSKVD